MAFEDEEVGVPIGSFWEAERLSRGAFDRGRGFEGSVVDFVGI